MAQGRGVFRRVGANGAVADPGYSQDLLNLLVIHPENSLQ